MTARTASLAIVAASALLAGAIVTAAQKTPRVTVPQIWNDDALKDWATPIAALGVRPGHFTSAEYYRVPADNLRTYPVYAPDREPPGYWQWLHEQRPQPMVDAAALTTQSDWIAAGARAFSELDTVSTRSADPKLIALARDPASFKDMGTLPDGSVLDARWVVTPSGVQLTTTECAGCHFLIRGSNDVMYAGPIGRFGATSHLPLSPPGVPTGDMAAAGFLYRFIGDAPGTALWRNSTTPWAPDARVEALRPDTDRDTLVQIALGSGGGAILRGNGSPFYGTKVPDLHTVRYSRYLDATATHKLRGPEDIARYAALINTADAMDFGDHRILTDQQRHAMFRYADDVLYAIGLYVMSLEPPRNPNPPSAELVNRGRDVFAAQQCGRCHAPPNFTTGELTLARGFTMPADHPNRADVKDVSVGTDPGLAMQTRKGTGFYKIPSLRGVWYRPYLLHDGAVTSLEEMFDAARLAPDYERHGWRAYGVTKAPVVGHPFGLGLSADDKRALLAFLRTL